MRKFKHFLSAIGVFAGLLAPVALHANASGPDPGLAGVPGELGTCARCHGTGAVNANGGSVSVNFGGSNTYIPAVVQHWVVTVADPSARRWGFEATARTASSTSTMAGGFKSTDTLTQVICSNSRFSGAQRTTSCACPSAAPLMYVEQTTTGTRLGTTGSVTFAFDWTPPATDVGPVTVYLAANAANGNNQDDTGDHIYSASYTLTPAAAPSAGNGPTITGVVNGASFTSGIEAGSWVTIQGTNLTSAADCDPVNNPQPGCRTWTGADFANGTPTSLDGVSVSMGGKPAFVYYVSPTQINVQAPDLGTGSVAVTVTNGSGTSNSFTATADSFSPAFFLAGKYAIATHLDGTLVAPAGMFPNSSPAKPGETVTLWGTGFGPVTPSVPAGETTSAANGNAVSYATTPPVVTIGDVPASVVADGLNPSALGLYQIAITVPASAPSGDQLIVATAGGKSSPVSGVWFSVQ
jgi:uncharacterized protein (TIGR03437 family)